MPSQTQLTKNDIDMPYWLTNDGVRSIRGTRLPDCSVIGSYRINSQSSHCFFGIQVLTVFVKCHLWLEVGTISGGCYETNQVLHKYLADWVFCCELSSSYNI